MAAKTVEQAPEAPAVFELGDQELSTLKRKGGREAIPSKFLEEVRGGIGVDKMFGIHVPEGTKGSSIIVELRKAAKQLNVHLKIWDRSDPAKAKLAEGTPPFVGFKVIDKPPVVETPAPVEHSE